VDRGDGVDDGRAEPGAVVGGAVVQSLERLEATGGIRRADDRARCWLRSADCHLHRALAQLIQWYRDAIPAAEAAYEAYLKGRAQR
jgi:hypothetical protein